MVLDVDWIWRRFLPQAWSGVADGWMIGQNWFLRTANRARLGVLGLTSTHLSPWSRFGEPWPTGATAMWAAVLLIAYLFLSY